MSTLSIFRSANAGECLAAALSRCLGQNANTPLLLLVSGGSALQVFDHIDKEALGAHVTVSVLDERFSREPGASNFLQLARTGFYKKAGACGVRFISSVPEEGESLAGASERWEGALRQWAAAHPSGMVVATLGIGTDGLTAGVMPLAGDPRKFVGLFEDKKKWVVGYDAGGTHRYAVRMTVSVSFLQSMVDRAFVYIVGEGKKDILNRVCHSQDRASYPASVLHTMKNVEIYTDIETP